MNNRTKVSKIGGGGVCDLTCYFDRLVHEKQQYLYDVLRYEDCFYCHTTPFVNYVFFCSLAIEVPNKVNFVEAVR